MGSLSTHVWQNGSWSAGCNLLLSKSLRFVFMRLKKSFFLNNNKGGLLELLWLKRALFNLMPNEDVATHG